MKWDPKVLAEAIEDWKSVIGTECVTFDSDGLRHYSENVSAVRGCAGAVLYPSTTRQVQDVVRIANRCRVPLYPLSCGKNWGLGSRLPVRDGCVVVDLHRMNRIIEVNVEHRYAIVEPGVTQGQLYGHLAERDLPLVLNATGAGLDSSLIGNALERGIGYFSPRSDSLSGMEIVLGNGELLRTGFSHYPKSKTSHTYRYGIGPSLDGLFCQSNFGIVTAAGIDLIARPEANGAFIVALREERRLGEFIEALADLRRSGIIQTVIHIANRYRTEATMGPVICEFLEDGMSDFQTLRGKAKGFLDAERLSSWNAIIGLFGTSAQLRLMRKAVEGKLKTMAKLNFVTDRRLAAVKQMAGILNFMPFFRRKEIMLRASEPFYGLSKGIPTNAALGSLYWPLGEMPKSDRMDPDQSSCGMLYCLPMMPLNGKIGVMAMRQTDEIFGKYGFLPCTTLNIIDAKTLEAVISLGFDRRQPEKVKAAHECLRETQQFFMDEGLHPYRVGVQCMSQVVHPNDSFWRTVQDLKRVLDPNHIIAPGRYNLV